jgi:hypothetical protein
VKLSNFEGIWSFPWLPWQPYGGWGPSHDHPQEAEGVLTKTDMGYMHAAIILLMLCRIFHKMSFGGYFVEFSQAMGDARANYSGPNRHA